MTLTTMACPMGEKESPSSKVGQGGGLALADSRILLIASCTPRSDSFPGRQMTLMPYQDRCDLIRIPWLDKVAALSDNPK